jgi:hypothetical protein
MRRLSAVSLEARRARQKKPGAGGGESYPLLPALSILRRGEIRLCRMGRGEVYTFEGVAAVELGDTLVSVWRAPLTPEAWRWYWSLLVSVGERFPGGALNLSVILSSSSPPNAGLRLEMQRDFRQVGAKLRRFIVLPLGSSLWFNVVRALVRGVLLISRQSKLYAVVASLAEALDELERAGGSSTPARAELELRIADACAALGIARLEAA